ncbi:MAG: hypothetical protein PHE58_00045 [Candidatus Omnitrophica bacterium]|nr:hypothetical protein [Candidatus Omnitrophota bacterium]
MIATVLGVLGFFVGVEAVYILNRKPKKVPVDTSSMIMMKRMRAIQNAQSAGKKEYDFIVEGPYPVLNR